jgi:hypothetical protein
MNGHDPHVRSIIFFICFLHLFFLMLNYFVM